MINNNHNKRIMTETIFTKENTIYKLECSLVLNFHNNKPKYLFKLMWREKRRKKWCEIEGYEGQFRVYTDMEDILKYLTNEEIMLVAQEEYKSYEPSEKWIFNE